MPSLCAPADNHGRLAQVREQEGGIDHERKGQLGGGGGGGQRAVALAKFATQSIQSGSEPAGRSSSQLLELRSAAPMDPPTAPHLAMVLPISIQHTLPPYPNGPRVEVPHVCVQRLCSRHTQQDVAQAPPRLIAAALHRESVGRHMGGRSDVSGAGQGGGMRTGAGQDSKTDRCRPTSTSNQHHTVATTQPGLKNPYL